MKQKFLGFTLIELLVVISIIGLLASVVLVSLNTARAKARSTRMLADVKQIQTALELYFDANGSYPQLLAYLNSFSGDQNWTTGFGTAIASYTDSVPSNPTEAGPQGYLYSSTNSGQKYGLAVGFFGTTTYDDLMINDGGQFDSYYELGPSPSECQGVGKDWWGATTIDCP